MLSKQIVFNLSPKLVLLCLVVYQIKVNSFVYLFDCTTEGRALD